MSRHAIARTMGGGGVVPAAAERSLARAEIIAIIALTVILLILFARAIGGTYNGNVATETQRAQRKASIGPRITRMSRMAKARRNVERQEPQMNADVRGYERGQGGQMTC